jgi:hypothetical protein
MNNDVPTQRIINAEAAVTPWPPPAAFPGEARHHYRQVVEQLLQLAVAVRQ